MLQLPQTEIPTHSLFHAGMYVRVVNIPAGVTAVGRRHLKPHLFFLAKGVVALVGDSQPEEVIEAPRLIQTEPGAKRAVFALEDALIFTIHRTDTTDVESAEAEMVEPEPDSPFGIDNKLTQKVLT